MKRLALFLILLASVARAQTPTPATFNPVPGENASFFSALRTFLLGEDADRYATFGANGRQFSDMVINQCVHSTAGGMTGTFAGTCLGIVDGVLIVDPAASINYSTQGATASDFCWVILTKDTTATHVGWTRVSGSHYMTDCTTAAGTRPIRPAESTFVMGVTISGSAITSVSNLSNRVPWVEMYTNSSEVSTLYKGQFWMSDTLNVLCYTTGSALSCVPIGDSNGCATCGDSATGFFTSGICAQARGCTGDDTSATTGVPIITDGNWTYPTTLPAAQGGLEDDFSGCTGVPTFTSGVSTCQPFSDTVQTNDAAEWAVDGVQCTKDETGTDNLVTNVPGAYAACADNNAGRIAGKVVLPPNFTGGGLIAVSLRGVQSAATAGTVGFDFTCLCVGDNDTLSAGTFPSAINLDTTYSTTTGDVQVAGTTITCGGTCVAGDTLIWRGSLDATATTHASPTDIHFINLTIQSPNSGQNN